MTRNLLVRYTNILVAYSPYELRGADYSFNESTVDSMLAKLSGLTVNEVIHASKHSDPFVIEKHIQLSGLQYDRKNHRAVFSGKSHPRGGAPKEQTFWFFGSDGVVTVEFKEQWGTGPVDLLWFSDREDLWREFSFNKRYAWGD